MTIPVTREAVGYLDISLRLIAEVAKERKLNDIYGMAQAGLDLAQFGSDGCATIRGESSAEQSVEV